MEFEHQLEMERLRTRQLQQQAAAAEEKAAAAETRAVAAERALQVRLLGNLAQHAWHADHALSWQAVHSKAFQPKYKNCCTHG